MPNVNREARIYYTVGLLFVFDQLLKWVAYSVVPEESFYIIPGAFKFSLFLNPGIIFSFAINNIFVIIVSTIILSILLWLVILNDRHDNERGVWFYSLLLVGGLSNFIDRLRISATIDYLHFFPDNLPIFNVADLMIAVGMILLITSLFRRATVEPVDNK